MPARKFVRRVANREAHRSVSDKTGRGENQGESTEQHAARKLMLDTWWFSCTDGRRQLVQCFSTFCEPQHNFCIEKKKMAHHQAKIL